MRCVVKRFSRFFRSLADKKKTAKRQGSALRNFCPEVLTLEDRTVPSTVSSITQNFNGAAIPAGDTIWFDAEMQASGLPGGTTTATVHVTNQTISFTSGGQNYSYAVPDADVVLTAGATSSSVSYDPSDNGWDIGAPTGGTGHVFMGGMGLALPNGLPGNVKNVTWSASFWSDTQNVQVQWQWGAAVYSNFNSDYNALGVKPIDDSHNDPYNNGDHAGALEQLKSYVVAGATGNGGNNYTGNFGPNTNVKPSFGDGVQTYPYASSNPLTSIAFNESTVLKGANLDTTNGYLDVWYSDEHALALGVGTVNVKTSSGTITTNYAISSLTSNPSSVNNPALGTTATSGDQAGTDTSTRPMSPEMFITDITNNPKATSGDWQWGGQAYNPSDVFGTWKSFTRTVDYTQLTGGNPTVSVTASVDPAKNGWNLGAGADTVPTGLTNEGYGTEIRWNLNTLEQQGVLIPGHTYRFYVMVHDGDQNKAGGDAGQAAFNFTIPAPPASQLSGFVTNPTSLSGIAGVLITATEFDSNGNVLATFTTTTGADGSYSFGSLSEGTYSVTEDASTLPVGYMAKGSSVGTVSGATDGSASLTFTLLSGIALNAGNVGINYDFTAGPVTG
jgi:hypothetical protein